MKEDIAFRQSKRLGHTRQHFDIFNALANWAVDEAGGGDAVFGRKPETAKYTPTNLGDEANRAVKSNIANMPDIQALLEKILPGWGEMQKQGSKNTLSMLRGEIPEDVQNAVKRSSAFRALSGGFQGSGMSKALTARDFGRTSLDLMDRGGNSAQLWAGLSQGSAKPFIVTAPDQAENTMRNNLYSQITEQNRMNVAAAPDPSSAGIFNLQTALGSMAASFGMSSALNGMKTGGGAGVVGGNSGGWGAGAGTGMSGGNSSLGNYWSGYNSSPYGPYASGYQFPPGGG